MKLYKTKPAMISQDEIRNKGNSIDRREEKLVKELAKLQATCAHPDVEKTYRSNTGNYDPTADSYWIDFHCPDCRKRWRKEQ